MARLRKAVSKYLNELYVHVICLPIFPVWVRKHLWSIRFRQTGKRCYIGSGVKIIGSNLKMGTGCIIGYGTYIDASGDVTIEDHVSLSPRVTILSVDHTVMPSVIRRYPPEHILKKTVIGQGCWLGANVTVLPGVSIGEGCVIAAGAIVNKDCKPNALYAGVPARFVRSLPVDSVRTDI